MAGSTWSVSGWCSTFLAAPEAALATLRQRLRRGGTVSAYVWDYAAGMEFLRAFWDEAVAVDARAAALDEGRRFPLCSAPALQALFDAAGLTQVDHRRRSRSRPDSRLRRLLGAVSPRHRPRPAFVASLEPPARDELRERLRRRLRPGADGGIHLRARAWSVRGSAPEVRVSYASFAPVTGPVTGPNPRDHFMNSTVVVRIARVPRFSRSLLSSGPSALR
jgi:hypothetical protein